MIDRILAWYSSDERSGTECIAPSNDVKVHSDVSSADCKGFLTFDFVIKLFDDPVSCRIRKQLYASLLSSWKFGYGWSFSRTNVFDKSNHEYY